MTERASSRKPRPGPLQGIRVLDFTAMLAGPHCARLMADLGAEVIKIEGLEGDLIRGRPPLRDGNSSYFGALNCGKKSLAIDLKSDAARPIVHELAKISDVVVENFRPGVMARLGFDYAALTKHNAKLVYCSISGYGQSGPGATRAAYAPIIHAASGYDAANLGYQVKQEYPASTGIFTADILSGAYAFGAIQAALVHRERTGQGQAVDVSLMDSMLNLMVFECQEAQFPSERRRPVYAPMKTLDGHVIIAPISQKNFEQMADAMQRPDLKTDVRFSTGQARVQHWTELMTIIEQWTEQRTGIEIESIMDAGSHEGSATG
jgi:CoA:oxalate CoA-transferase